MKNYNVVGKQAEYFVVSSMIGEGFEVFNSMTNNSRVDYVALDTETNRLYKIQVKTTIEMKDGCLQYTIKKSSKNYSYIYKKGDFDIYAFVYLPTNEIMYKWFDNVYCTNSIHFRVTLPKNNQVRNINLWCPNTLKSLTDNEVQ